MGTVKKNLKSQAVWVSGERKVTPREVCLGTRWTAAGFMLQKPPSSVFARSGEMHIPGSTGEDPNPSVFGAPTLVPWPWMSGELSSEGLTWQVPFRHEAFCLCLLETTPLRQEWDGE